jgi:hypothetical protein
MGCQSASLSWCQASVWGPWPSFCYCQTVTGWFVDVERSLWREDGPVIYNFCLASSAQSFLAPSRAGVMAIISNLRLPQPGGPIYTRGTGFHPLHSLIPKLSLPSSTGLPPEPEEPSSHPQRTLKTPSCLILSSTPRFPKYRSSLVFLTKSLYSFWHQYPVTWVCLIIEHFVSIMPFKSRKADNRNLWADCLDSVRSSTSRNPIGLHFLALAVKYLYYLLSCISKNVPTSAENR